jgi:hypothetical protein
MIYEKDKPTRKACIHGLFQGFRQGASRSVKVQFVNFISWVVFVLDVVLSDRSDTTCQIRGFFVRIDSLSFRGSAGESLGSLGPIFLILDNNAALDIFENVSVLGYADDLKLFMTIRSVGECQLFQRDLDRLSEWCRSNKFDLNADGECKSISFRRNMRPIEFVYAIIRTALESVDEIKDLGVIMDG